MGLDEPLVVHARDLRGVPAGVALGARRAGTGRRGDDRDARTGLAVPRGALARGRARPLDARRRRDGDGPARGRGGPAVTRAYVTRTYLVPGRVELVGKHVDYAGGRSLTCAIEPALHVRATPLAEPVVQARDASRREKVRVPLPTTPRARPV